MSLDLFPVLIGQGFIAEKSPVWSTQIMEATSGRERRRKLWSYPRWRFKLNYEVLRDFSGGRDLTDLLTFFNAQAGRYEEWGFLDPTDNAATTQYFGTGNGATTGFQLLRTASGGGATFTEPVRGVYGAPVIYKDGVRQYTSARTNRLPYSQQFDMWSAGTGVTVGANASTAPDGSGTADRITNTVADTGVAESASIVPGATYTASCYIKNQSAAALLFRDSGDNHHIEINTATWTVTATSSVISHAINYIGNDWYRVQMTFVAVGSTCTLNPRTTGVTGVFDLWGAQLEAGSTATDYIPTTTAAVTIPAAYSLSDTGVVTFVTAPAAAAVLTWTGQFLFRCRFDQDDIAPSQMMAQLWSLSGLQFYTVKR